MIAKNITIAALAVLLLACAQDRVASPGGHEPAGSDIDSQNQNQAAQAQTVPADPAVRHALEPSMEEHIVQRPLAAHKNRAEAAHGVMADMSLYHQQSHPGRVVFPYQPATVEDRENYLELKPNGVFQVAQDPVSTFSVDVDTAAYSNVRRMLLREGRLPPMDAVKVEEFINYFDYDYPAPAEQETPFSIHTSMARAPWGEDSYLLQVGLKGYQPVDEERPTANLVFLVDVSGSMRAQNKLALVKKSLRLLVNQLGEEDRVALVVYAGAAGQVLESTPGSEKAKILAAIDGLEAGGSTNGGAGITLAYSIARQHRIEGGINRVLIASDGDMNVGTVSIEALKEMVAGEREAGIALTTLGYGSGNYNYALMEQIADVGDGNAAYIDNLREAHKVLVKELGSTLQTIARDVKIQIEFNPSEVAEYRLIGYENRLLAQEDFNNDKVDAGDIGVGHTVTALYEITLADSAGKRISDLRYGNSISNTNTNSDAVPAADRYAGELGVVRLRYKEPEADRSRLIEMTVQRRDIQDSLAASDEDFRFAVAVAGFGQLLQGGKYTGDWSYTELLELARGARGDDRNGYRGEMVALVELSRDLSTR
jgi:Ca-activated chloride channel family protein